MAFARKQNTANREEHVRIGPLSLFTLIAVICLAVLAVLEFSTANASKTLADRQRDAVSSLYVNETAAQCFMAQLDDELAASGKAGVDNALGSCVQAATDAAQDAVEVSASYADDTVYAEFTGAEGRALSVEVTIRDNATYRIDKWKVVAVQNEEEPQGNLWTGD